MHLSSRHKGLLILAFLFLSLGILNYVLFQRGIALFSFIHMLPASPIYIKKAWLRHFMTGYFSDIAWCLALYMVTALLTELKQIHLSGKLFNLLLPFIIETAQFFHIIPGTFDWFDILTYLIILVLFLFFSWLLKLKINEKS